MIRYNARIRVSLLGISMSVLRFLFVLPIIMFMALMFGCSSGTPRTGIDPNSYGTVSGQSVTGPVFSIESLQQFAIGANAICNGLDLSESGTVGDIAQLLCLSNKLSLSANPGLSTLLSNGTKLSDFIVNNPVGVTSVASYRIIYTTAGAPYVNAGTANDGVHNVSAAVLVPQVNGHPLAESSIKGVLLYFHATIISKGGVPSDFYGNITDPTANPNSTDALLAINEDMVLASIYASQGFVVVVPDYVGQGIDWTYQHPYVLFPQTNVQSGFNAIKAARTALTSSELVLPTQTKLYISAYSEGGAYAIWASKMAQMPTYANFLAENGFNLVRTAGASGVYDLSGAMLHFEFSNASNSWESSENIWNMSPGIQSVGDYASLYPSIRAVSSLNIGLAKPPLTGYILTTFVYYNSSTAAFSVLAPEFSAMQNCLSISDYIVESTSTADQLVGSCPLPYNIAPLYNMPGLTQSQVGLQALYSAMGVSNYLTGGLTSRELFQQAATGFSDNAITNFVTPGALTDPTLIDFAKQQDIISWTTTSPIDIIYLDYDSTVTNVSSQEACGIRHDFIAPGQSVKDLSAPGMVNCINVQNASNESNPLKSLYTQDGGIPIFLDHSSAQYVLQLFALNQFLANK